ncbi:MAG: glycogen debranching protein GlgX [Alphaproteobacteria bacterium]|nr:glycogen debranching protein GlgX [Alphaproteobacteria bacterium]
MASHKYKVLPGRSYPLGATYVDGGVNFALYSSTAQKVELCLFGPDGKEEVRLEVPEYTDEVFNCFIPGLQPGQLYGYRVYGPYDPQNGLRFNHNKLLIDPYAKAFYGKVIWSTALFGYKVGDKLEDLSFDRQDSAPYMPKCVVVPSFSLRKEKPRTRRTNSIIYEVHVKGATKLHPKVPEKIRGTFKGLADKHLIKYYQELGITALELLPVQSFFMGSMPEANGLYNYWGYNTVNFFTPEPAYLGSKDIQEFRDFVDAYHAAGIEIFLDVVYNHTAEGSHLGPTLSFRGIDNESYYKLMPSNKRYYYDSTGVGNTFNMDHPKATEIVMDSLRYWVKEMGVDGFRFDLAVSLGRTDAGFMQRSSFYNAAGQDPTLQQIKKIAEPWDIGMGGYQLGNFPAGWSEWNGLYRDSVRKFWRGDSYMLGKMANAFSGSSNLFERRGRRPWASVNFITSHDGFTLHDLVSYNHKHNTANGEHNRDGDNNNNSYNHGHEGPTDNPKVNAVRRRQIKNMLATNILSQGLPMLLGGDELGRSQNGNNNTYSQDNKLNWIDWEHAAKDTDILNFTKKVIAIRKNHTVFRRSHFFRGALDDTTGKKDIVWLNKRGEEMTHNDWNDEHNRTLVFRLSGDNGDMFHTDKSGVAEKPDNDFYIIMNANDREVKIDAPVGEWNLVFDTSDAIRVEDSFVHVPPKTFVLFEQK